MKMQFEAMKRNNAITADVSLVYKNNPQKTVEGIVRLKSYDLSPSAKKRIDKTTLHCFDDFDEFVSATNPNNTKFDFFITGINSYEKGIIECNKIKWDTDGYGAGLPKTVYIDPATLVDSCGVLPEDFDDEIALDDAIVDYLSDEYGYCVNSYNFIFVPNSQVKTFESVKVSKKYVKTFEAYTRNRQ